jgi:LacI family transcriptional regulator
MKKNRKKAPKTGKRVGIRQVADSLSLSVCTVSRILNDTMGDAKYRKATIERVRRAAKEMGYRPDMVARSLVSGRTRTIGLCLADIANPVFGEFAAAFERDAARRGYATFVCNAGEDPAAEKRYVDMLVSRRVDALVISPVGRDVRRLKRLADAPHCRVVLFDRCPSGVNAPSVLVNNRNAMRDLASRCLGLGHTRIGVLTGSPADSSLALRLKGVRDALRSKGLRASSLVTAEGTGATTVEGGATGMRYIWKRKARPTLALSLSNVLSMGALGAAKELGIRIGQDVSFAGFDDFPGADLMSPGITVAAQPVAAMAKECAALACAAGPVKPVSKTLKAGIIWRESVGSRNPL